MNFKSIGLKAAIATAVVASSTVAMAPAQAFTFHKDSHLIFNVNKELASVTKTGIKFTDNHITVDINSTKTFAPYGGTQAVVKDIAYAIGPDGYAHIPGTIFNFITLAKAGLPTITFDLTGLDTAEFTERGTASDTLGELSASIEGVFHATGPGIKVGQVADPGSFLVAVKKNLAGGVQLNNFNADISVPTPALLPGLLGLGAGFVRKRKQLAKQEANA